MSGLYRTYQLALLMPDAVAFSLLHSLLLVFVPTAKVALSNYSTTTSSSQP
jgi:uncharacterized membrane protein